MQFTLDDNFWNDLGGDTISEDTKAMITEQITDNIGLRCFDALSPEKRDEFISIADPSAADAWLKTNVPNFDTIVSDVIAETKEDLADLLNSMPKP